MSNRPTPRQIAALAIIGAAGFVAWQGFRLGVPFVNALGNAARGLGNVIKDPGQAWRDYQREGQDFIDKNITGDAYPEGAGTVPESEREWPLTVRLNNPGAIRFDAANNWQGSPNVPARGGFGSFERFDTADAGARAQIVLMLNHITGRSRASGGVPQDTLAALLNTWAPPEGVTADGREYANSTSRYIENVVWHSGLSGPDAVLFAGDYNQIARVARAMAYYEAGGRDQVPERWQDLWFWLNAYSLATGDTSMF